ncbi:MAG: serine hydrolase domain-containing protein [Planctomycetota bacterium]
MHRIFAVVVLSIITSSLRAQPDTIAVPVFTDAIQAGRSTIAQTMDDRQIPGMSVSMRIGGNLVWSEAFGLASVEHQVPATRDTRFRLASISKVFTGTLAGRLAARGVLDLDADVREYEPRFPEKDEGVVTTRQILAHTSGIRHYIPRDRTQAVPGGVIDVRRYPTVGGALMIFREDPLLFEPGSDRSYSTFAFTLAQAVIEKATGETFGDLIEREISGPLGLESIVLDKWDEFVPNRTDFFTLVESADGTERLTPALPLNNAYKFAGGGLIGTPDDLTAFGAAHLQPGYLDAQTHELVFTPYTMTAGENAGKEINIGLAWQMRPDGLGGTMYYHGGSQTGTRCLLVIIPQAQLSFAIMSNTTDEPGGIEAVTQRILGGFLR